MKMFAISYVSAVIAFLLLDGLWLGVIAKYFYASQLGQLMRDSILVWPAAAFYLLYAAGLVFLAVRPSQPDLSLGNIAVYGAMIGFLAYGTYDMTNLSTIREWPLIMSAVDLIWGTVLSATVSVFAAFVTRHFAQY